MLNQEYVNKFRNVIVGYRNARSEIFSTCSTFKAAGYNQKDCSTYFTEAFKQEYPIYDFTTPANNPQEQKRIYDNIRKAISDFWKVSKPAAPQPTVKTATTQLTGQQQTFATAEMTLDQLEELVMKAGKADPCWAKMIAEKLLNI